VVWVWVDEIDARTTLSRTIKYYFVDDFITQCISKPDLRDAPRKIRKTVTDMALKSLRISATKIRRQLTMHNAEIGLVLGGLESL